MPRISAQRANDDYLDLVRQFPLKRLRTEGEHTQALGVSRRLIGLSRRLSSGEGQYLDALVVLIRDYEAVREAKGRGLGGIRVLKHLLAEHGMTQRQLAELLSVGESAASMILSGERELTKSHIGTLASHFGVGVGAFF